MPGLKRKPKSQSIHTVRPALPGPWQYLDLLPMITLIRGRFRGLPRAAYPLIALVILRTYQQEQQKAGKAMLRAHREAIRRSQPIYIVRPPKKKRFILF